MDDNKTHREKARLKLHTNSTWYFKQILEAAPLKNTSFVLTYLRSQKPFKQDEQNMWGAREAKKNS